MHTRTPPHLAHPASCAPRILRIPHLAHAHAPAHAHSAGRGSQDFGTSACSAHAAQAPERGFCLLKGIAEGTYNSKHAHPQHRAAERAAPAAESCTRSSESCTRSSAQTSCCRAGRNEGRKATRLHQGSPGLCCRLTRVHLARPAAPDVLLSLLPTGRNDGTQGHLSHRFM